MSFWTGFYKRAESGLGGSGFSGVGKANLPTGTAEVGSREGTTSGGDGAPDDTKVDKTLLDRQRNPGDFQINRQPEPGPADVNPHIWY